MSIGKLISFDQIECGKWFVSPSSDGLFQVGLVVQSEQKEKRVMLIAGNEYKIVRFNDFEYVYLLDNAEISIEIKSATTVLSRAPGVIVCSTNGAFIRCEHHESLYHARISDGAVLRPSEEKIMFSRWSLVHEKLDGYETIHSADINL